MDATPTIISDGVLWASTPLFAAANLWPWHPLWAAGIWTAYGISALFPQGEALLTPLTKSPLRYNFDTLDSPLCGQSYGSVICEAPTHNNNGTMSILVTPKASASHFGYALHANQYATVTSVTTPKVGSSSPESSEEAAVTESRSASTPSTSLMGTQPCTESDLDLLKHKAPLVIQDRSTIIFLRFLENSKIGSLDRLSDYRIKGRKVRTWLAEGFLGAFLILLLALSARRVRKLLRWFSPGEMHKVSAQGTAAPNAHPSSAPALQTASTTPAADIPGANPAGSHAPADWNNIIRWHIRQWARSCVYHWRIFQDALVVSRAQANLWAGNLVWLDVPPPMRVVAPATVWVICMYLGLHLLEWILVTDLVAWVKSDKDSQTAAPSFSSLFPLPISTSAAIEASNNALTMIVNSLRHVKHCTACALQTPLNPDSSYETFDPPPSWTGAICKRIVHMVMSFKSIPLALSNLPLKALERCYNAAWTIPISQSGIYDTAPHSGPTASLCSTIELIVMSARSFKHFPVPHLAPLNVMMAFARRVSGCLPWASRNSGIFYTRWLWQFCSWIFHTLTPMVFSAVFMLNTFAITRWLAPPPANPGLMIGKIAAISTVVHFQLFLPSLPIITFDSPVLPPPTRLMLVKRVALKACLVSVPAALLVWFLRVTSYQLEENRVFIMSTTVVVYCSREWVEPKWNAWLQWLGVAPWEPEIAHTQNAQGEGTVGGDAEGAQ